LLSTGCILKGLTFSVALILSPAISQADEILFDIRANGFRYGDFALTKTANTSGYSVAVSSEAKGLFGFMIRAKYSGKSSGVFNGDGNPVTTKFTANSSQIFAKRTSEVEFEGGKPVSVVITPLKRRTTLSDPSLLSGPYLDPLSFLANTAQLTGASCPMEQQLYDGRRITQVSFEGQVDINGNLTCSGGYEIIQGPDHSLQKDVRKFAVVLIYTKTGQHDLRLKTVELTSGSNVISLHRLAN
jgi:hypothetical protein